MTLAVSLLSGENCRHETGLRKSDLIWLLTLASQQNSRVFPEILPRTTAYSEHYRKEKRPKRS